MSVALGIQHAMRMRRFVICGLPGTTIYRVIQEESAPLWEMIVRVILSKKGYMKMCPIFRISLYIFSYIIS
jgi:hypothetical protein